MKATYNQTTVSNKQKSSGIFGNGREIFETSSRLSAISSGGISLIRLFMRQFGLAQTIEKAVHLLKQPRKYLDSDHILSLVFNTFFGGQRLEDMKLLRHDQAVKKALGMASLPDSTTAGDFLRRFDQQQIEALQQGINEVRAEVWKKTRPFDSLKEVYIDIDGTVAPTEAGCKEGIDYCSYKKLWGYGPLIVSVAQTKEVLFLKNRPANNASHTGCAPYIRSALELVSPHAPKICLRGDTDFSLTEYLDEWDQSADFVFGYDAKNNLVKKAKKISEKSWKQLERKQRTIATQPRQRPHNYREEIVETTDWKNIKTIREDIAEIEYQPLKCKKPYRLVILRKQIHARCAGDWLYDEFDYFFYITNKTEESAEQIIELANQRCDQENVIAQLKSELGAMNLPVDNLLSNWAHMVITSLAWNIKSWLALTLEKLGMGRAYHTMRKIEWRTFLNRWIRIPVQVLEQGRRVVFRILSDSPQAQDLMEAAHTLKRLSEYQSEMNV